MASTAPWAVSYTQGLLAPKLLQTMPNDGKNARLRIPGRWRTPAAGDTSHRRPRCQVVPDGSHGLRCPDWAKMPDIHMLVLLAGKQRTRQEYVTPLSPRALRCSGSWISGPASRSSRQPRSETRPRWRKQKALKLCKRVGRSRRRDRVATDIRAAYLPSTPSIAATAAARPSSLAMRRPSSAARATTVSRATKSRAAASAAVSGLAAGSAAGATPSRRRRSAQNA